MSAIREKAGKTLENRFSVAETLSPAKIWVMLGQWNNSVTMNTFPLLLFDNLELLILWFYDLKKTLFLS